MTDVAKLIKKLSSMGQCKCWELCGVAGSVSITIHADEVKITYNGGLSINKVPVPMTPLQRDTLRRLNFEVRRRLEKDKARRDETSFRQGIDRLLKNLE